MTKALTVMRPTRVPTGSKEFLSLFAMLILSAAFCYKSKMIASRSRVVNRHISHVWKTKHRPNFVTNSKSISNDEQSWHDNIISSPQSATVKKIQAILSKRKKRREFGQTLVEGPRMVFDLLENPLTETLVQQVLISTEDFARQYQDRLGQLQVSVSPRVNLVTPPILKSCSDTMTPQGIVALVDIPFLSPLSSGSDCRGRLNPLYLVLDGVSDPGNVGTLIRSSLAVGVAGVILLPECCDVWNPKAVRSAMGASFQIPILEVNSWDEAMQKMTKDWNIKRIYAATMMDDEATNGKTKKATGSQPYYNIDWLAHPSALVIGSEGSGLSQTVRNALVNHEESKGRDECHQVLAVHVPMQAGIESLNAAICGSVIMFEYLRQCENGRNEDLTVN